MKCINKKNSRKKRRNSINSLLICVMLLSVVLTGCGNTAYELPYESDSQITSFNIISREKPGTASSFASELCIVTEDITNEEVDMSNVGAAVLFDVNNSEVLYSKNAHVRMNPASITKIMTAIVALKYGSKDQVLKATDAVKITESGAVLCNLKDGDTMTLNQALHLLLIHSANDVAMLIAENIGGTVEEFVALMNEEANALGATNTNFMNPHGLTQEDHYTTAYDLYLIFNQFVQNDFLQEIIRTTEYQTTYYDKKGSEVKTPLKSNSNLFFTHYQSPDHVTVVGGKTGTTNAAGHCLILLSRDVSGSPYISVILRSQSRDLLYPEMIDLLNEINK